MLKRRSIIAVTLILLTVFGLVPDIEHSFAESPNLNIQENIETKDDDIIEEIWDQDDYKNESDSFPVLPSSPHSPSDASIESRLNGTAETFEDLERLMQSAVAAGGLSTIKISQSFDFPRTIQLNITKPTVNIVFQSEEGTTLGVDGFYRHFDITASGTLILELKGTILDGRGLGGGIYYTGTPFFYLFSGSVINCVAYNGGGLSVNGNAVIEAMHFSGNTSRHFSGDINSNTGGAVYIENGELLLMAETLIEYNGSEDVKSGGGVYAAEGCSVSIRSAILQHNEAQYGGGISLGDKATLDMVGYIQSNKAVFGGGGIYGAYTTQADIGEITETSYINIKGHVKDNEAGRAAGGICGGVVTINKNGFVSRNTVIGPGSEAGISCARFIMEDGIVSNNTLISPATGYTPGVGIKCTSALINGGTISGNTYVNETGKPTGGGGIFCSPVLDGDTIVINGGIIAKNKAHHGGGVFMFATSAKYEEPPALYVNGGQITGNEAVYGGGLLLSNIEAEFSGNVELRGNTAKKNGGAIWTNDLEKLSVSNSGVIFTDNLAEKGYQLKDEAHIALHESLIKTNTFSRPYQYAYNNYDVVYLVDEADLFYTINYNNNGGTGNYTQTVDTDEYQVLSQADTGISRKGYNFTGWNGQADGKGEAYKAGQTIALDGDLELYAQWKYISSGGGNGGGGNSGNGSGNGNGSHDNNEDEEKESPVLTDAHRSYVTGYPDSSFQAARSISRAEMASIFFNLIDAGDKDEAYSAPFSDVPSDSWYHQAAAYIAEHVIMVGYPDGSFGPEDYITRGELTAACSKFFGIQDAAHPFTDVSESHWANEFIANAYIKGWITGYSDGSFKPDQHITRAEAVTLMNKILNRTPHQSRLPEGIRKFTDLNTDHWAYADIIEASHTHDYTLNEDGFETWQDFN